MSVAAPAPGGSHALLREAACSTNAPVFASAPSVDNAIPSATLANHTFRMKVFSVHRLPAEWLQTYNVFSMQVRQTSARPVVGSVRTTDFSDDKHFLRQLPDCPLLWRPAHPRAAGDAHVQRREPQLVPIAVVAQKRRLAVHQRSAQRAAAGDARHVCAPRVVRREGMAPAHVPQRGEERPACLAHPSAPCFLQSSSWTSLAWVAVRLYDHLGFLNTGKQLLGMWMVRPSAVPLPLGK